MDALYLVIVSLMVALIILWAFLRDDLAVFDARELSAEEKNTECEEKRAHKSKRWTPLGHK